MYIRSSLRHPSIRKWWKRILVSFRFFKILFCREGSGEYLIPGTMNDDAMEIIVSSDKITEQARLTVDSITALNDEISNERSYILRYTRFLFLSYTCITYMLQTHFHNGAIDSNLKSLKKSFSLLNLLPLHHDCNDELTSFMKSSIRYNTNIIRNILDIIFYNSVSFVFIILFDYIN